jgi:hypothetical protein
MDLIRKILLTIEEEYQPGKGCIKGFSLENYTKELVAEHCDLLYQDGLIKDYSPHYSDNRIGFFTVGPLTSSGHDFIAKVRDQEDWDKIKQKVEEKRLPKTIENFSRVSGIFVGNVLSEIIS